MTETISHYKIEKKLGEGGVGEVFRAVDPVLGRPVAIKRLRPELASREQIVARFKSEARTLAQLNHPNIATLYSFERDGDSLLMVMEYVEGETLSTLLRRDGAFPLERALPLIIQALDALGYAHERGVIHRDIKGPNLMLRSDGVLKVMDFGIARVIGSERVTQLGQLVGTPEFMSPEQIRGHETDARSDIYSLGVLCYALLVGRVPFSSQSGFDVMKAQIEMSPAPPSQTAPHPVPEELDAVIGRALEKRPQDRYASTAEFRACLAPFLSRRSSERRRDRSAPTRIANASAPTPGNPDETTEDMPVPTDRPTCILADEDAPTSPSASRAPGPTDFAPATRVEAADPKAADGGTRDERVEGAAAVTVVGDVAQEAAPPMSRLHQAAWVLAPSLLAILWMGVSALWTEMEADPPIGHATAVHSVRPVEKAPALATAAETSVTPSPSETEPTESIDPPDAAVAAVEPPPAAIGEDATEAGPPTRSGDEASPTRKATKTEPAAMAAAPATPARRAQPPTRARPSPRRPAPPARPAPRPEATKSSPTEEEKGWVIRRR